MLQNRIYMRHRGTWTGSTFNSKREFHENFLGHADFTKNIIDKFTIHNPLIHCDPTLLTTIKQERDGDKTSITDYFLLLEELICMQHACTQ